MMTTDMPPAQTSWISGAEELPRRNVWRAIARGLRGRCPHCGKGKLFSGFLKVAANCSACGEDLSHHRADDLPAYLVIVVVGHIMVPLVLWIETDYAPPVPVQLAVYLPLTLAFALVLLQPVKGAVVGLQWAFRMHGFGVAHDDPA
ncbi:hypothetical protein DB459_19780 [Bradyrhizobium sp. WD16]|nr:hypothetical protein DB459_19780 [Bradyrhizobium sp. WD16]